jgi:hypothetical protein
MVELPVIKSPDILIDHSPRQKTIHLLVDKHRAALLAKLASAHGVRPMAYIRGVLYEALAAKAPKEYAQAKAADMRAAAHITKGPKIDESVM